MGGRRRPGGRALLTRIGVEAARYFSSEKSAGSNRGWGGWRNPLCFLPNFRPAFQRTTVIGLREPKEWVYRKRKIVIGQRSQSV